MSIMEVADQASANERGLVELSDFYFVSLADNSKIPLYCSF